MKRRIVIMAYYKVANFYRNYCDAEIVIAQLLLGVRIEHHQIKRLVLEMNKIMVTYGRN